MTGIAAAQLGIQQIQSCDSAGNQKDTFGTADRIYVTKGIPANGGVALGDHAQTGKIWIVDNAEWGSGFDQVSLSGWSYQFGSFADVKVDNIGASSGDFTPNAIVDICAVADLSGTYPDYYDIIYDKNGDGLFDYNADGSEDLVDKIGCQGITTVPEFATIAIPAVAILGLFLFFNHRKQKEE